MRKTGLDASDGRRMSSTNRTVNNNNISLPVVPPRPSLENRNNATYENLQISFDSTSIVIHDAPEEEKDEDRSIRYSQPGRKKNVRKRNVSFDDIINSDEGTTLLQIPGSDGFDCSGEAYRGSDEYDVFTDDGDDLFDDLLANLPSLTQTYSKSECL